MACKIYCQLAKSRHMSCHESHSYLDLGNQIGIKLMAFHNAYEDYQKLNEQIAKDMFQEKLNLRIYQTALLAAFDITSALQQFLAHKPNIGICKNGSSLIDSLSPSWQRTSTPMSIKSEKQSWYEFIENLSTDTAFVIWSSENEITGEIILTDKQILEIHQQLAQKRIYSIQIVHEENFSSAGLLPYSVLISRSSLFEKNAAIAIFGEKFKAPTLIGYFQDLSYLDKPFQFKNKNIKNLIDTTELKFADSKQFYFNQFANIPNRLSDRVVFYFPDIAGCNLQEQLMLNSDRCFTVSKIPFWILDLWKNWWKEAESEKLIRGLCVINIKAFQEDPQLIKKIELIITTIRQQNTWSASQ